MGQTRHRDSVAEVLADSVRVATYGTRARVTLRELERHAAAARDVSIHLPVGVDALAWACAFHQTGTGRTGPLVVSDGTTAATHPVAYWSHETDAPTRRAEGGTLVVLHVTALPEEAAFRGVIHARLARSFGPAAGIFGGGLAFGAAHAAGGPMYVLVSSVAGLGYGWIYAATGSIRAAILAHAALNTVHLLLFTYPALTQ